MVADQVQEEFKEAAARLVQGAALWRQAGAGLEWTPLWAARGPGDGAAPRGRRQGALLGNPLTQEVSQHRGQSEAGLWGKPSALLEEADVPSCGLKAKTEGEDGQQSAEGPWPAGVREAREREEVPKGRGTGAHTHLLDDHSVPQRASRLQMLHELPQVRPEVREGGHLPAEGRGQSLGGWPWPLGPGRKCQAAGGAGRCGPRRAGWGLGFRGASTFPRARPKARIHQAGRPWGSGPLSSND